MDLRRSARTLLLLAGIVLVGLTGVSNARADMNHHAMMMKMMMHGGPVTFYLMNQDRLGLSKDQVKKLSDLKDAFRKTVIMEKAKIKVLHLDVMKDMMHRKIDTGEVRKDMDQILIHKKKIMDSYLNMIAKAHLVLSPKQFEKVRKLWREMMMMHHGMMEPHHHM
ncbi:MAG: hypothetical protein ACYCTV_10725 [Leptospirales bacterium]